MVLKAFLGFVAAGVKKKKEKGSRRKRFEKGKRAIVKTKANQPLTLCLHGGGQENLLQLLSLTPRRVL